MLLKLKREKQGANITFKIEAATLEELSEKLKESHFIEEATPITRVSIIKELQKNFNIIEWRL